MGGGSKTETQQTVEKRDPWEPAQPMLKQILGDAQSLYNSGAGTEVYGGDTTAGLGQTSQAGIQALRSNAAAIQPATDLAQSFISGTAANQGQNGITWDALAKLNGIGDSDLSGLRSAVAGVDNDPAAAEYLRGVARGDMLDPAKGNPYLDDLINQSARDAAGALGAKYSASGRYGSAAMGRAIADTTGRIATETRADQYDKERARQVEAAQLLDATELARNGLKISGEGSVISADQGNKAAAATRATTQAQIGQNGQSLVASLIPQLDTLNKIRGDNASNLLLGGSLEDAAAQADLDAAYAKWQAEQDAPFRSLGLYQAVAQPIAGLGYSGESTTTKTTPQPSLGQSLLGGGLGVLGLLTKGGLFGSDEEIKEGVEKVGKLPSGVDLVEYDVKPEYAGGEFGSGHMLGVLAQDVAKVKPEAVAEGPDGLLRVDYAEATDGLLSAPVGLMGRGKGPKKPSRPGLMAHRKAA